MFDKLKNNRGEIVSDMDGKKRVANPLTFNEKMEPHIKALREEMINMLEAQGKLKRTWIPIRFEYEYIGNRVQETPKAKRVTHVYCIETKETQEVKEVW